MRVNKEKDKAGVTVLKERGVEHLFQGWRKLLLTVHCMEAEMDI